MCNNNFRDSIFQTKLHNKPNCFSIRLCHCSSCKPRKFTKKMPRHLKESSILELLHLQKIFKETTTIYHIRTRVQPTYLEANKKLGAEHQVNKNTQYLSQHHHFQIRPANLQEWINHLQGWINQYNNQNPKTKNPNLHQG